MRRWWCAAAGVTRRLLSYSSAATAARHVDPVAPTVITLTPLFSSRHLPTLGLPVTASSFALAVQAGAMKMQVRHYAKKERSRAPLTPTTSKLKKYKLKAPSSMKFRFRTMHDGQIRRWRAGKRHNAHLKSKAAKRRLRKPEMVHLAYAKVIKKLNFCG